MGMIGCKINKFVITYKTFFSVKYIYFVLFSCKKDSSEIHVTGWKITFHTCVLSKNCDDSWVIIKSGVQVNGRSWRYKMSV